jgi:tetratricopeptide (TPR) repeat protein
MHSVSNGLGKSAHNNFIEDMTEGLTDGVSFELMTQAVDLKCGHSYNESTIVDLSRDLSKYLCPECRAPITGYQANYTIRRLAGRVALAPAAVEPQIIVHQPIESNSKGQIEEAEEHFRRGRALCEQGKQEEGVNALFKALELDPNNEKAYSYLEFVTDPKNMRKPSVPPLVPEENSLSVKDQLREIRTTLSDIKAAFHLELNKLQPDQAEAVKRCDVRNNVNSNLHNSSGTQTGIGAAIIAGQLDPLVPSSRPIPSAPPAETEENSLSVRDQLIEIRTSVSDSVVVLHFELNKQQPDQIGAVKRCEVHNKLNSNLNNSSAAQTSLGAVSILGQLDPIVPSSRPIPSAPPAETEEKSFSVRDQLPPVLAVQAVTAPVLPSWVFGSAKWKEFIGDPGVEPPIPPDILQRLPELSANNVLVLIPATVDGEPLNLKSLQELVVRPLKGNAAKCVFYFSNLGYKDAPVQKSHWALLTRTLIEGSRNKSYKEEQAVLENYSYKTKIFYQVPNVLDVAICNCMEFVRTGRWLYSFNREINTSTQTFCQEKYYDKWQLIVGGGSQDNFYVNFNHFGPAAGCPCGDCGVAGLCTF